MSNRVNRQANGSVSGLVEYICAVGTDGSVRSIAEAQNRSGNTAFHWAAVNGHLDVVKALVSAGAQTSKLNKAGRDAVLEAEAADKLDVVTWLLENGDELPELPDRRGVEHTTVDDDDDDSTEQASELQLAKE